MSRHKLIIGNWKQNLLTKEALVLVDALKRPSFANVQLGVAPVYSVLDRVAESIATTESTLWLGAQDIATADSGAFTGEVGGPHLVDAGCSFVIVGHSERRTYFGDTDDIVAKKTESAFRNGLLPIVCVGESAEERAAGVTEAVVRRQVDAVIPVFSAHRSEFVIAYEPVWAIGTGLVAQPVDAEAVHLQIRQLLSARALPGDATRIIYGGSMKPDNSGDLFSMPNIDGGLVGGASLKAADFLAIAASAGA